MSQHSLAIANEAGAAFRADVNNALQALASQSSGASAPSTMYAYMRWADTTNGVIKRRNAANGAWVLDGPLAETYAVPRSSNTILALSDYGKSFRATSSFTQTLTAAATLGDGWWCAYRVDSGVSITFDPNSSENIDGATTKAITGPSSGVIFCDGTGFYTYGFGNSSVTASGLGTSAMNGFSTMINGTIVHSRAGNAETIAIKTYAGADPSSSDPVYVIFRNVTAATGDYVVITLTAATSITINSTATMGFTNSTAARIWLVGFNDAGTFRLGVINCLSGVNIYPLGGWGIASSTTIGTGADSAQVFYSDSGVTSKAYTVLGYSSWESGLATAGTWNTAPTRVQLFGAGVPLPGQPVQRVVSQDGATASGTTTVPYDDTIPQSSEGDQYMSQAITPTSAANVLHIDHNGIYSSTAAGGQLTMFLLQDATASALKASVVRHSGADELGLGALHHEMRAGTTAATTMKIRAGLNNAGTTRLNGASAARLYGGVAASFLAIEERMA